MRDVRHTEDAVNNETLIELKLVSEDRRFYVTRYFHAAAFYLAILALGVKLIVEADTPLALLAFLGAFQLFNGLAFFLGNRFKQVVYDSLRRECELAKQLSFKEPAELLWGYWAGFFVVVVSIIGFCLLAWERFSTMVGKG